MRSRVLRPLAMLLFALIAGPAHAQIGANVSGVIADNSGAILPGVTVTVTNTATGRAQTVVTGEDGRYRVVALQPGPYEVTAELQGFGTVRRQVVLPVGADATVDVQLGVAALAETVTVVGEAPLVEVAKSQPSSVVTGEQLEALPVLNRNFLVLAQLMPGAGPVRGGALFAVTKFGGIADQRFGYITLVDGGDLHEPIWGHPSINLSQDSVAEFKVFRNQFDAEYGGALTAIVNVVSKAGTNRLRGTGYYFGRDDALNAKNAYAAQKPPYEQVRAGVSFGGPIAANRTHFFGSYEQQKTDSAAITALPASNPFAALENGAYANFTKDKNALVRFDHRINSAHNVYVRYAIGDWIKDEGLRPTRVVDGVTLGSLTEIQKGLSQSVIADEKWILSDRKLNSLRVHVLDNQLRGEPHSFDTRIQRPSFTWGQFHRDPQHFPQRKFAVLDTFFLSTGNHDLKFGGEVRHSNTGFEAHHFEHGNFIFNTDAPFNPNNPATYPFSFEIRTVGFFDLQSTLFAGFVQDTWRIGDRLNLNLGYRYDFETSIRDNENHFSMFSNPRFRGIDRIIDGNRGSEWDNSQPRLGATWNVRGDGTLVARAGWGYYVTLNQPWYAVVSQQQYLGTAVLITDPQRLRLFPNVTAVLGGRSVEDAAAAGGTAAPQIIGNNYGRPRQATTTAGVSWQLTGTTSLDADVVAGRGSRQLVTVDRNLPASGPISAANPRPVSTLARVAAYEMLISSSYDALEMQVRQRVRGGNSLQVSYTLSRSLVDRHDGTRRADFFNQTGYNPDDTRHNLTTSLSTELPGGFQVSGIVRFVSGFPLAAHGGLDLDGDGQSNDRPQGLPVTVGRGDVDEQLRIINAFRAERGLPAFDKDRLTLNSFKTIDLRATKAVAFGNARRLEVFLEAFNVANFVNRIGANGNVRLASFGIPTGATDARQVQWGARYSF